MTTATSIQTKLYIDGKWCDALDGKTHAVINPATEEVLWEVAYGSRAETKLALEAVGGGGEKELTDIVLRMRKVLDLPSA